MVNPGFYSDSHWRFPVTFSGQDMRYRVWLAKLYEADGSVAFQWKSNLPAIGDGTIDISGAAAGTVVLNATAEQHAAVTGDRPYTWSLYDISTPDDPIWLAGGAAFVGSAGAGRTVFTIVSQAATIQPPALRADTMLGYIQGLLLTTSLTLSIDAGNSASYSGSGQQVSDTSGAGNHYYLGATVSVEASDPSFNGTPNGKSEAEFFSVNGVQYLTSIGAGTLVNAHKDNAKWTIVGVIQIGSIGTGWTIIGTGNGNTAGFQIIVQSGGTLRLQVKNSGAVSLQRDATIVSEAGKYIFFAVSIDEGGGDSVSVLQVADQASGFNGAYTAPSTGAADGTLKIFARPNGTNIAPSGSRLAAVAVWDGVALTAAQIAALRLQMLGRWSQI